MSLDEGARRTKHEPSHFSGTVLLPGHGEEVDRNVDFTLPLDACSAKQPTGSKLGSTLCSYVANAKSSRLDDRGRFEELARAMAITYALACLISTRSCAAWSNRGAEIRVLIVTH